MAAETATFRVLAREWWKQDLAQGSAEYAQESWRRLERDVLPYIGDKDPRKVTTGMIRKLVRRVEERNTPAVARKIKSHISQTFDHAIQEGKLSKNPARDVLVKSYRSKPRRAITEPRDIGRLMRDIEYFKPVKRRLSLKIIALTWVRPGELVQGEWSELDWNACNWRIAPHKMKMKRPHIVPLPRQAMDAFRELHKITGNNRWFFPSRWDKSQHEQGRVLNSALSAMGYSSIMTAHGFRAMGATTLSELGWVSETIERQLAHTDKNAVRAAYQRSDLLPERRKMMDFWGDFLDLRCAGAILGR